MDISRSQDPWKENGTQYFGHADLDHARSSGKSNQEILDWANANLSKMPGGNGTSSKVYQDLLSSVGGGAPAAGGSKKAKAGSSNANSVVPVPGGGAPIMEQNMSGGSAGNVGVWQPEDLEGFENPFLNSFNTNITQTANVDNRTTTSIGDGNTFGAGSSIGNNNAYTAISQYADASRGEAKERALNRLIFAEQEQE